MIYRYDEYDHPAGFIGLRVAVSIDGKVKQKYFSLRERPGVFVSLEKELKLIKEASKLDKKWRNEQAQAKLENKRNAMPGKSLYTTRVKGISMISSFERKSRSGVEKIYRYLAFSIHISHERERFSTTVRLKKDGSNLGPAWKKAVDFVCKNKKMRNNKQLYQRKPTKKEFFKISPSFAVGGATKP